MPEPAGTCFSALVGRGMAMCVSRRLVRVASAVLLVLLMAGVGALAGGAADHVRLVAAGGACNRTRLAPPTSRTQSELSAVASVSPREAWAVGWQGAAEDIPLVEHFDGQAWREVTDLPVRRGDHLYGIAAVSARDVWVLGTTQPGVNSFVLRWDGSNWRRRPLPTAAHALMATRAGVIWIFAYVGPLRLSQHHWHVERQGLSGKHAGLGSAVAISEDDVWAVGNGFNRYGNSTTYAAHWNGRRWTVTPTPKSPGQTATPKGGNDYLTSVTATGPSDVWATAYEGNVLRWNGYRWRLDRVPRPLSDGISAFSPTSVWAVGGDNAARWDGARWSYLLGTHPSGVLNAVAAVDNHQAWAVGTTVTGAAANERALIERLHCTSP